MRRNAQQQDDEDSDKKKKKKKKQSKSTVRININVHDYGEEDQRQFDDDDDDAKIPSDLDQISEDSVLRSDSESESEANNDSSFTKNVVQGKSATPTHKGNQSNAPARQQAQTTVE